MEKNKNVIMTGDWHMQPNGPISRIDDYLNSLELKVDQIVMLAKDNDAEVIIPGDLFSKVNAENEFMNKVFTIFNKFKEIGSKVYVIFGNHDVYRTQFELEDKTPLKLLENAGLVKVLRKGESFVLGNMEFCGFGYYDEITPYVGDNVGFLIAHKFYRQPSYKQHNLNPKEIIELGYQYALLGHDHVRYEVDRLEGLTTFRPGGLMRGTSHEYNFTRDVIVTLLNPNSGQYLDVKLNVKPMQEVVSSHIVEDKKSADYSDENRFEEYIQKVDSVVVTSKDEELSSLLDRIDKKKDYSESARNYLKNCIVN